MSHTAQVYFFNSKVHQVCCLALPVVVVVVVIQYSVAAAAASAAAVAVCCCVSKGRLHAHKKKYRKYQK